MSFADWLIIIMIGLTPVPLLSLLIMELIGTFTGGEAIADQAGGYEDPCFSTEGPA